MLLARGFGLAGPIFQPNNIVQSGGTLAPAFDPNAVQGSGWTRWGIHALWDQYQAAIHLRAAQVKAALVPLIPPTTTACPGVAKSAGADLLLLNPLGIATVAGVPFTASDFAGSNTIVRTYTPTPEQQFVADVQLYYRSQQHFLDTTNVDWDLLGGLKPGALELTHDLLFNIQSDQSLGDYLQDHPEMTLHAPGMSINPFEPTLDESTKQYGLRHFYERGGFLLWRDVFTGAEPADSFLPRWGMSYCLIDPTTPGQNLFWNSGHGADWNYNIDTSKGPASYTITLNPRNLSTWQNFTSVLSNAMNFLSGVICAAQPALAQVDQQVLTPTLCQDAKGKPCAKAGPGCTCTAPPSSQTLAVQAGNTAVATWCSILNSKPPPPIGYTPPTITTPPPPQALPSTGWMPPVWAVVLGGLTFGAYLFSRK